MILKIILTKPNINIPINNQKELNSFIHRCLGENNKYHDTFSDYSISSLQGGKLNENKFLIFSDNPYIICNTNNMEFITSLIDGLNRGVKFFDMKLEKLLFDDFIVNEFYDKVITISPILIKYNNYKITHYHEKWLETLINQSKNKLNKLGVVDDTFDIKIRNFQNAKEKSIYVGNVFNPSTMISLIIYGKPNTRKTLYNLGLGNSTGSGFGCVKLYK